MPTKYKESDCCRRCKKVLFITRSWTVAVILLLTNQEHFLLKMLNSASYYTFLISSNSSGYYLIRNIFWICTYICSKFSICISHMPLEQSYLYTGIWNIQRSNWKCNFPMRRPSVRRPVGRWSVSCSVGQNLHSHA